MPADARGRMKRRLPLAVVAVSCVVVVSAVWYQRATRRVAPATSVAAGPVPAAGGQAGHGTAVGDSLVDFRHEPLWAYGFDTPPRAGDGALPQPPPGRRLRPEEDAAEQTRPRRLKGSSATFTLVDVRDAHNVIDLFSGDHPPMPSVVVHGPAAMGDRGRGCGSCHLPNGKGRPENAPVAGLPKAYFGRQIEDFRAGRRHSADPRKRNTTSMIDLAKAMTSAEVEAAATYFTSVGGGRWIRVVESALVPKTRLLDNLFLPLAGRETEPIADRIIEMPENEEQSELYRNPRSGFVAYAPVGSVAQGRPFVARAISLTAGPPAPCITCHGIALAGVGDVPPLAGRSPSYITRQMWDIREGTRNGISVLPMKPIVAGLSEAEMRSTAAHLAQLRTH
jgi:cytochrome c553